MEKEIINSDNKIKVAFRRIKERLGRFSFRTGIIVLLACIPLYAISFAQFALPISIGLKSALWVIFFGLAKTAQYAGLTIVGAKGISALLQRFKSR